MSRTGQRLLSIALLTCGLAAAISCGSFPDTVADARGFPFGGSFVQEGEVYLSDGQEATIHYTKVYQSPPRLILVEFRQSWFKDKPYSKSDIRFFEQTATGFRVMNNHPEPGRGAAATFKWRAEGVLAAEQPAPPALTAKATPDQVVAAIKALGGTVTIDRGTASHPVIAVDLHHQRIGDDYLERLRVLPALKSLNLSGTHVGDEGMKAVGTLTKLQVLQLNDTAVGNAGLAHLQGLTEIHELGLYHTRVTDDGLPYLKGMKELHDLTLSGARVTDRGMGELTGLHNLRHLILGGTGVTRLGVQELKKSVPKVEIVQ